MLEPMKTGLDIQEIEPIEDYFWSYINTLIDLKFEKWKQKES